MKIMSEIYSNLDGKTSIYLFEGDVNSYKIVLCTFIFTSLGNLFLKCVFCFAHSLIE